MALDFPSSPTNGQVYGNYYYNSARGAWNALLPAATPNFFTNATLNTSTLVDATAVSSTASSIPFTVNGLSGQTASLQQWKDSAGTVLASVNIYGAIASNYLRPTAPNATAVPVIVKGAASQTANLQEWQDSSGTVISQIDSIGRFNSSKAVNVGGFTPGSTFLGVQTTAATPAVMIKGGASQTADLQQWQSSTGSVLSKINSSGEIQTPRIGVGATMPTTTMLQSTASAVGNIPIVAQGAASQTANLQEWQNSSGTVLSKIAMDGKLTVPTIGLGGTTATGFALESNGRLKVKSDGSSSSGIWLTGNDGSESLFVGQTSTASSGDFGVYHNGAWRLNVDNSGRMFTPYQPAFRAYGPSAGSGATISFSSSDSAFSGRNGGWNGSYRFTAPVAGVYLFTFSILCNNNSPSYQRILFKINGVSNTLYGDTLSDGHSSYTSPAMAMYFKLNANDYVELHNEGSPVYSPASYGSFSGALVG